MVLSNDVLNAFYLQHMIKDHSESERRKPLTPLHEQTDGIAHTTIFITPDMKQCL